MKNRVENISKIVRELKEIVDKKTSTKLSLDLCERMANKLASLAVTCEDCQKNLLDLENRLIHVKDSIRQAEDIDFKQHQRFINKLMSHFKKEHKLVQEGYYLGIYMSFGISLGVVFGLTVFNNIALGIPIGLSLGLAIGSGVDSDAKKKGKTI